MAIRQQTVQQALDVSGTVYRRQHFQFCGRADGRAPGGNEPRAQAGL